MSVSHSVQGEVCLQGVSASDGVCIQGVCLQRDLITGEGVFPTGDVTTGRIGQILSDQNQKSGAVRILLESCVAFINMFASYSILIVLSCFAINICVL